MVAGRVRPWKTLKHYILYMIAGIAIYIENHIASEVCAYNLYKHLWTSERNFKPNVERTKVLGKKDTDPCRHHGAAVHPCLYWSYPDVNYAQQTWHERSHKRTNASGRTRILTGGCFESPSEVAKSSQIGVMCKTHAVSTKKQFQHVSTCFN